jgi:hypothetical protein
MQLTRYKCLMNLQTIYDSLRVTLLAALIK